MRVPKLPFDPRWLLVPAVPAVGLAFWLTAGAWPSAVAGMSPGRTETAADARDHDDHAGHDHAGHDHEGHADGGDVLRLSGQARGTIGLRTAEVRLSRFDRTITVPGVVSERAGRSDVQVSAPMTGVVTDVFVTEGRAVRPGDPLFILRLTHEDVVQAQTDYLKTLEALDVEDREIARLRNVTRGVVAGKVVLEREYEKQKLEGLLKAQRQGLLLHGLAASQVDSIAESRNLVREIRVDVPAPHDPADPGHADRHGPAVRAAWGAAAAAARPISLVRGPDSRSDRPPLTVERLDAHAGDAVTAGAPLAELSDLGTLYIEGLAFERDAAAVAAAAREGRPVAALPADALGADADPVAGLKIAHVANRVGEHSRAVPFYVLLPNEVVRDDATDAGRFLTWRYKPGQRMRLRIPVETYEGAIVLPVGAVAESGADRFAFVENGAVLERRPVRVTYRDAAHVVVADDGSLLPGETVAVTAAHQLQMALRNAAGGAPDPHAGHDH